MSSAEPSRQAPARGLVLAATTPGVFLAYLDITIVNVVLATLAKGLETNLVAAAWVITGYNVSYAALLVTAGRLADAYGRATVYRWGLLGFALASALCALAWDIGSLVAFRIVQGVFAAVLVPVSLALMLSVWPATQRGAAIGAWSALGALGAGLGPLIGGVLAEPSWRFVFAVNLPIALYAVYMTSRVFGPETRVRARVPIDVPGIALLASALATTVLAILKVPDWGLTSEPILTLSAVSLLLWVLFIVVENRTAMPILDATLFRIRSFSIGVLAGALFFFAFLGYSLLAILVLQGFWGWSPLDAGLGFSVGPLLVVGLVPIAGRLVDKFGARRIGIVGLTCFAGGMLGMGFFATSQAIYLTHYFPFLLLVSMGLAPAFPSITTATMRDVPAANLGAGTGVLNTIRQIGGVLGVSLVLVVVGELSHDAASYRLAFGVLTTAVAVAALALWLPQPPQGRSIQ